MRKVYVTKGLPASGKTTWSLHFMFGNENVKRVSCDELGNMIDRGEYTPERYRFLLDAQEFIICNALYHGFDVVVDNTHLNPKRIEEIEAMVKGYAEVEIVDFTHVPLEKCIERDSRRSGLNRVGEERIRELHDLYLAGKEGNE